MSAGRLAALVVALLSVGCPALREPDDRARSALEALSASGFTVEIQGAQALRVPPGKLGYTGVHAEKAERGTLRAFGQLSLEGWSGERPVSYLGAEAFRVACRSTCAVEGSPVSRLAEVLAEVLPGGDRRDAGGWFIRVERDTALVAEVSRDGTRQRRDLVREDGRWVVKDDVR